MLHYRKTTIVRASAAELFHWHLRPGALARLTPPWQALEVLSADTAMAPGTRVELLLGKPPLRLKWIAEHTWVQEIEGFEDIQVSGPFRGWRHRHLFEPISDNESALVDSIEFSLPLAPLSEAVFGRLVLRSLGRSFDYRHRLTQRDLEFHHRYAERDRLRVALAGHGGVVSATLSAFLSTGGHQVVDLCSPGDRGVAIDTEIDAAEGSTGSPSLEGLDGLVYMTGDGTRRRGMSPATGAAVQPNPDSSLAWLVRTIGSLKRPPACVIVVSALPGLWRPSAAGPDGNHGLGRRTPTGRPTAVDAILARPDGTTPIRWVDARIGVVLSPQTGNFCRCRRHSRPHGDPVEPSQERRLPWISIDDAVGALTHLLLSDSVSGSVDVMAPTPARLSDLRRICRGVIGRRWWQLTSQGRSVEDPIGPEFALGEEKWPPAPVKLVESGYRFRDRDPWSALSHLLGCP